MSVPASHRQHETVSVPNATSPESQPESKTVLSVSLSMSEAGSTSCVDIGSVFTKVRLKEHITELDIHRCLENRWRPVTKDDSPYSLHTDKGGTRVVKRFLGLEHLERFSSVRLPLASLVILLERGVHFVPCSP